MNQLSEFVLKSLHKIYTKFQPLDVSGLNRETDPDKVSNSIYQLLTSDYPCMIARFGSTELNAITNYYGVKNFKGKYWKYIIGQIPQCWWNNLAISSLQNLSGFFPATQETVSRFSELMLEDMLLVDLLGSWRPQELYFKDQLNNCKKIELEIINPYWSKQPWSRALAGRKVLVIHPFAQTIEKQYKQHREKLFLNPEILPLFELRTIQAVQSLGGSNQFSDWFAALAWMENEMDKTDYDICLIGCGAYGFPLAAHAKRKGKKAVHLGGSLQLLFGIRGTRWEDPNYNPTYNYSALMNEYWVKPDKKEKPDIAEKVEGACYW